MSRRIWTLVIGLGPAALCSICGLSIIAFGLQYDLGPFSSESRAHLLIQVQGSTHVVLEPDVPPDVTIPSDTLMFAKTTIHWRLEMVGIAHIARTQGARQITLDIPGRIDPTQALNPVIQQGLVEFVDVGDSPVAEGTVIRTTGATMQNSCAENTTTPILNPSSSGIGPIYQTLMTSDCLVSASVTFDQANQPLVSFSLQGKGTDIFAEITRTRIKKYLAIVKDKQVLSCPIINSPITAGTGIIAGNFTLAEANELAMQLRYGPLPVPLKIVEVTQVR